MSPRPRRREPDRFDAYAARRLYDLRVAKGWTQTRLAQAFGVSYQQVQKFENGANRLSAGRLATAAAALGVPVTAFFPKPGEDGGDLPAEADPRMRRLLALMTHAKALSRGQLDNIITIAKACAEAQATLAAAQTQAEAQVETQVEIRAARYITEPGPMEGL